MIYSGSGVVNFTNLSVPGEIMPLFIIYEIMPLFMKSAS